MMNRSTLALGSSLAISKLSAVFFVLVLWLTGSLGSAPPLLQRDQRLLPDSVQDCKVEFHMPVQINVLLLNGFPNCTTFLLFWF
jgi:hypothetical protein